jgi:hypothetical protein
MEGVASLEGNLLAMLDFRDRVIVLNDFLYRYE